ncbi:response regulator transcription factor [Stenotrophomonas sp. PS02298]|uniref:LytR/AlgR family response regulator transcription factor n=1 Tax=Stenotrophomonas sp. PS02298 TaxID=2991424 RepID=UPI00249A068A|nr:response regulator transcription factor [Stenotrophomonas sp. PS02298]
MHLEALIAEDEPLLRQALVAQLQRLWPELDIVAECEDGAAALEALETHKPDLAFLDIRMPGITGLDVARALQRLSPHTEVVFVTAYDQYAISAFEQGAVDYLLKPVSDERLVATRQRVLARRQSGNTDPSVLERLLQQLARQPAAPLAAPPLAWITASNGRETRLVMLDEVLYFRADSKYTVVVTAEEELLLRSSLRELTAALDANSFRQIHRATIVNMKAVAAVSRDDSGRGVLRLKQRSETLMVSQPFMSLFRGM